MAVSSRARAERRQPQDGEWHRVHGQSRQPVNAVVQRGLEYETVAHPRPDGEVADREGFRPQERRSTVAVITSSPPFPPNASTSTPLSVNPITQLDPVNSTPAPRNGPTSSSASRHLPAHATLQAALTPLDSHPIGRDKRRARPEQRAQPGRPVAQYTLDLLPLVIAAAGRLALADEPGHAADDEVGGVGVGVGGKLEGGPGGGKVVRVELRNARRL